MQLQASIKVGNILPGRNPRGYFDPSEMTALEDSVKSKGVLQAILSVSHTTLYKMIDDGVFPEADGYAFPNNPKHKRGRPYWNSETVLAWLKKKP